MARPLKYKTPEDLESAVYEYFQKRGGEGQKPPTISGLALHLGFEDRQSIYDYKERPKFSHIIKKALLLIEDYAESVLLGEEGVKTGAIFWLKNHKWIDKSVVDTNIKDYTLFESGVEQRAKKYANTARSAEKNEK